eukprot:m.24762 g.24762  ORF g.24762 m.24762 type:complete len:253 (-) comp11552_c0_seq3:81-839(-)
MAEDDYMSDAFIQALEEQSKPKAKSANAKRRKPRATHLPQAKKRHVLEQEQRDKGLQTQLSASNKGFRMLKAMGYKGGSLGKTNEGIVEPIDVSVKTDKSGLGTAAIRLQQQQQDLSRARQAQADTQRQQEALVEQFAKRQQQLQQQKADERDLFKAQRACHQLDTAIGLDEPTRASFWPAVKETAQELPETDELPMETEPPPMLDVAMELATILKYLRSEHCYCFYCGTSLASDQELQTLCPGVSRFDHDN